MDYWSLKWDAIASERVTALTPNGTTSAKVSPMNVFSYLEYVWPHIRPFFHRSQSSQCGLADLVQPGLHRLGCPD